MNIAGCGKTQFMHNISLESYRVVPMSIWPQDAQKGRSARPQAYPHGYVEDLFKARRKLADFFSILLCSRKCGPTNMPPLILLHCLIVLHERRGELVGSVVPRDKIQGARIGRIECRANRLNARVGDRSRRQSLHPIGIVGTGIGQVFLAQVSVE